MQNLIEKNEWAYMEGAGYLANKNKKLLLQLKKLLFIIKNGKRE